MRFVNKITHLWHLYRQEFIVSFVFMLFAFGFNIYRIQGDGKMYYSFLEGILHIANPETGGVRPGFMQAGCVVFNAPFYLAAYMIENIFNLKFNSGGITLRTISINLASNFYMILSAILVVKILRKLNFRYVSISILSVIFSTSVFVVAVVMPSYNHAVDIFVNTLCLYLLLSNAHFSSKRSFALGFMYVIAMFVRYFNIIWIIPIALLHYFEKAKKSFAAFLLGVFSIIWLYPVVLYVFNGGFLSFFVGDNTTEIVSYMVVYYPKYFFKILIHPLHGIFIWSPVLILSFIGQLKLLKTRRNIAIVLFTIWFLTIAINSFSPIWYAGWSFSVRYIVCLFPVFVIGIAAFLEEYGKKFIPLVVIFTLYSIFLFFNWYLCVIHGEFGTPFDLIAAWQTGRSETFAGNIVNLQTFFAKIMECCRYKYLLRIF